MLQEYAFVWRSLFIVLDLSVSASVFLLAYQIRFQPAVLGWFKDPVEKPPIEAYILALPALYAILFITNSYFRLYQPRRISRFLDELVDIVRSNILALLVLLTVFFFSRDFSYSRSIVVIFAVLNPLAVFLFRASLRSVFRFFRSRGHNLRTILIVGTGRPAQALLHRLRKNTWTGIRVTGFVSLSPERVGKHIHGVPVLGAVEEIGAVYERHPVHQVFIALPLHERQAIESVIEEIASRFVPIRMVPDISFLLNHRVTMDFDGIRIVSLWENHLSGWNMFAKRILDIVVALAALAALGPVLLLIALVLKLMEGGPVFYVQQRMGHDGRIFPMFKFRTMRSGSEDDTKFTGPGDERCTLTGRFLRRTSLDELPQLLNVLVGHMSLVGPRPERPVFIETFRRTMPGYMLRHKLKAGMTGWAQVNGWRGATSLKKRLQYDLYYLHHWSLWFDLKILLITLFGGWTHRNAY
ncbi:MAG TPA: undecaprenyl-phosphate glucose phosphotransferase [Planctomycetota bacterium]|nr:undecaprenyl-phosphate glucose phosphotransferase [Planctomycetota bacterium]